MARYACLKGKKHRKKINAERCTRRQLQRFAESAATFRTNLDPMVAACKKMGESFTSLALSLRWLLLAPPRKAD